MTAALKRVVSEGDLVVLWGGRDQVQPITVTAGSTTHNKWGAFKHDEMIGKSYGSKVYAMKKGWLYMMFPTPEIWAKGLQHRTQILYTVDIAVVSLYLELKPGTVLIESGTGSGALTTAMARHIAPTGKLYTFEYNAKRAEAAKNDFQRLQIDDIVKVTHRDVCKEGFQMKGIADAVFLDLPSPWEVIESAEEALLEDGKLVSFSPCIEQVHKTCEKLRERNFEGIKTIECLMRSYDVRTNKLEKLDLSQFKTSPTKQPPNKRSRQDFEELKTVDTKCELTESSVEMSDVQQENSVTVEAEEAEGAEEKKEKKTEEEKEEKKTEEKIEPRIQRIPLPGVVVKPFSDIRGHTGFLTFARKAVGSTSNSTL